MKRLCSVVLILMLFIGMVGTASATSDSLGQSVMDGAESYLRLYVNLSKLSKTGGDEYIDRMYGYALLYLNGQIVYYTDMDKLLGVETVNPLIYGFSDMINYLSGAKIEYVKGNITKEEFKKRLLNVVNAVLSVNQ